MQRRQNKRGKKKLTVAFGWRIMGSLCLVSRGVTYGYQRGLVLGEGVVKVMLVVTVRHALECGRGADLDESELSSE
jgi:hypothetical protein